MVGLIVSFVKCGMFICVGPVAVERNGFEIVFFYWEGWKSPIRVILTDTVDDSGYHR